MAEKIKILSTTQVKATFGTFTYRNRSNGSIIVEQAWIDANIVNCVLPKGKGNADVRTQCHRLAKEPLERAFQTVADKGLSRLIHTYDGLWVPRHQVWKNSKPLSRHSWGIAFDLNAATNGFGNGISPENRALNEIFNLYGFAWGGDWTPLSQRDAMHWELADVNAWKEMIAAPADEKKSLILAIDRGNQPISYYRVLSAKLEPGQFMVDRKEVAGLLNVTVAAGGRSPIRDLLAELKFDITREGDHMADAVDPRLYLFVKKRA